MLRLPLGKSPAYCDGLSRRSFLQIGLAGMGTLGLGDLWRAQAASDNPAAKNAPIQAALR